MKDHLKLEVTENENVLPLCLKLALHKNRVEFRQQFNGAICTSLARPYEKVRRRAT